MKLVYVCAIILVFQGCGIKGKPLPPVSDQSTAEKQSSDTTKIKK